MRYKQGGLGLYYSYHIKDAHSKTIKKQGKRKSRSFVKAFIQIMNTGIIYVPTTITDTGGTGRANTGSIGMTTTAGAATTTYGIVVGSDNTAVTINDYKLGTKITSLSYGASTIASPAATASVSSVTLTRVFTNGTGSGVTINEIGLYSGSGGYYYCLIRDVPTPIVLGDGEQLTLNYIIQATV